MHRFDNDAAKVILSRHIQSLHMRQGVVYNPVARPTKMTLLETVTSGTPSEYSDFLAAHTDSAPVGDFVLLYGHSDLAERNETFEVQSYLPGWVAIGDDGGGTALLMQLDGSSSVFRCGHGAIGSADPEPVAESFAVWLAADCPASWMDDDDDYGDD